MSFPLWESLERSTVLPKVLRGEWFNICTLSTPQNNIKNREATERKAVGTTQESPRGLNHERPGSSPSPQQRGLSLASHASYVKHRNGAFFSHANFYFACKSPAFKFDL